MSNPARTDSLLFCQIADKTVASSNAETSALGAGIGTKTLFSNAVKVGQRIRIHGEGVYSAPLLLGSLVIKVKLGSTVVATVTTSSLGVSALLNASNKAFTFDCLVVIRDVGATGKVIAGGSVGYTTLAGSKYFDDLDNAGAETTVDFTSDLSVDVTVQWDASSSSRSVKTTIATITMIN